MDYIQKFLKHSLLLPLVLAIFWVLTHWEFFDVYIYVLGWNASFFWVVLIGGLVTRSEDITYKKHWVFLVPLLLISLSFGLYENPWVKVICFVFLPAITSVFFAQAVNPETLKHPGLYQVFYFIKRFINPILFLPNSLQSQTNSMIIGNKKELKKTATQIGLGIIALLILAGFVVIPLLSYSDPAFEALLKPIMKWIFSLLDETIFVKLLTIVIMTITLGAILFTWSRTDKSQKTAPEKKQIGSIIPGIVLSGIFILYLLFLWVQLERLFMNQLPFDFAETVHMVKSGFWQLFFLSGLNVILCIIFYRKTSTPAQRILQFFIAASGFLLLSAAWRMGLYVWFYGLSYEKFFASYTVLFALGVFAYLLWMTLKNKEENIFKILLFSVLWAFSIMTVLPIEQIIYQTNMYLHTHTNSRLDIWDLQMLSVDVYASANKDRDVFREHQRTNLDTMYESGWSNWDLVTRRKWYQTNLSFVINKLMSSDSGLDKK